MNLKKYTSVEIWIQDLKWNESRGDREMANINEDKIKEWLEEDDSENYDLIKDLDVDLDYRDLEKLVRDNRVKVCPLPYDDGLKVVIELGQATVKKIALLSIYNMLIDTQETALEISKGERDV